MISGFKFKKPTGFDNDFNGYEVRCQLDLERNRTRDRAKFFLGKRIL